MKLFRKKYDYPYITAWGKMLGSFDYYIKNVIEQAQKENAPKRSVYKRAVGTWCTLDDCNKEVQEMIEKIVKESADVRCKKVLTRRQNFI